VVELEGSDARERAGGGVRRAFALVVLGLLAGCGPTVPGGVPVAEEPRHRLVSDLDFAQVLDIQILVSDTTLFHTHARPIAYTCVSGSSMASQVAGADWGQPGTPCVPGVPFSVPGYAESPLTHRVANDGLDLFHLIAVQSLRDVPGPTALGAPGAGNTAVDNEWFRAQTIELAPGQTSPTHRHEVPTLMVLTAGSGAASTLEDGRQNMLMEQGAWMWHQPGSHTLAAVEGVALRVVEVEVK